MARISRPAFRVYQERLNELLDRLNPDDGEITIPDHQRKYCWTLLRQQELIDTVLSGLPVPSVIFFQRANRMLSLEDGHQRLKTLLRFRNNEFALADGRRYRDMDVEDRLNFDTYPMPVLAYRNATNQQVIEVFNRFQNGSALSVGERLYSLSELSPLVRLAKRLLMTPGEGLHNRAAASWGKRGGEDTKRKNLLCACALVAGLAFDTASLSRKWVDFERRDQNGVMALARDVDEARVVLKLERILRIYEASNGIFRVNGQAAKNKLWNMGTFTGYIVHCLNTLPETEWDNLETRWANFIAEARRNPQVMGTLTVTIGSARSWTVTRWENGCRVVLPDLFPAPQPRNGPAADTHDDEEEEEEEEEEYDDSDDTE